MSDGLDGGSVPVSMADMIVMIGALTNAVTNLAAATGALARGETGPANGATARAGKQIDTIIALMQAKLGDVTVDDGR